MKTSSSSPLTNELETDELLEDSLITLEMLLYAKNAKSIKGKNARKEGKTETLEETTRRVKAKARVSQVMTQKNTLKILMKISTLITLKIL